MHAGSCRRGIIAKCQNDGPIVFNIGEVWNPVCRHGSKTVQFILWNTSSTFVIQTFLIQIILAEISIFIIFDQTLVEFNVTRSITALNKLSRK